jgi:hypothetical protein
MTITTSSSGQVSSSAKAVRASADTILVFVTRLQAGYIEEQPGRRTYESIIKAFVVLASVRHYANLDAAIEQILLGQSTYPTVYESNDPKRYNELVRLAIYAEKAHEHKKLESSKCLGSYKTGERFVDIYVGQLHGLWYVKEEAANHDDTSTDEAFETEEEAVCVAKAHLAKCQFES